MRLYYKTSQLNNIKALYVDGFILTNRCDDKDDKITLMSDYAESTDSSGRWKGFYIEGVPDVLNENQECLYQNIKTLLEAGYKVTNCIYAGDYDNNNDVSFCVDEIEITFHNRTEEKRLILLSEPLIIQNH